MSKIAGPLVKSFGLMTALAAALLAAATGTAAASDADENYTGESAALYNGRWIDLSVSWEGAQACRIAEPVNECFDTEDELDDWPVGDEAVNALLADCSTPVRLYDGTSYATPMIQVYPRLASVSLSTYGFANRTSSYRVGACSAAFFDSANALYPGATGAGNQASSMVSGWNNVLTRVYLS